MIPRAEESLAQESIQRRTDHRGSCKYGKSFGNSLLRGRSADRELCNFRLTSMYVLKAFIAGNYIHEQNHFFLRSFATHGLKTTIILKRE